MEERFFMKEITDTVKENFNIEISSISPFRDNYIICNNSSKQLLKKVSMSPERIYFIHNAKEHLIKNNFKCLDRYFLTKNDEPYIKINNILYTLTPIIDGIEINFEKWDDVINSSHLLANFHKSSMNFFLPENTYTKNELGKIPMIYKKRLNEIKRAKKIASKSTTKFDYLLLKYIDYFYNMGIDVIDKLIKSKYMELVEKTIKDGSFCHHEFTHNNIINNNGKYFLINFEFCCYELKIYDLCNLVKRKLRKCNWDIQEAKKIIDSYQEKIPLSNDELYIMKLMIMFPQKFWRVINSYYNSKKNLSDKIYISKLNNVIDEIKPIELFLQKYDDLFLYH